MKWLLSHPGMLLAGVVTLFLASTTALVLAEDTKPKSPPDPIHDAVRRLEAIRKLLDQNDLSPLAMPGFRMPMPAPRLGAGLTVPGGALMDQLDLPKGQGLVLTEVDPDSAAGKAGLKKHDILLELNGKKVPSRVIDFAKLLTGIKANTPVDAVVLRKGKKETIKGLTLPEKKSIAALPFDGLGAFPNFPKLEGFGGLLPPAAANADVTTITRNNDQFTATQKSGKHTFTVKGKIDQGKAKVDSVVIDDGDGKKTYDSMDKVPADHRKRVEDLVKQAVGAKDKDDY